MAAEIYGVPPFPLKPLPVPTAIQGAAGFAPRIELVCGRDYYSAGLTVVTYGSDASDRLVPGRLLEKRWKDLPQSVEECVQIACDGLNWALENIYGS